MNEVTIVEVRAGNVEVTQGDAVIVDWDEIGNDQDYADFLLAEPDVPERIKAFIREIWNKEGQK